MCFHRFIFWGMAYLTLHPGAKKWAGIWRSSETVLNYGIIVFGFYILVAGTYVSTSRYMPSLVAFADNLLLQTSIKSIIIDFNGQKVFSCVSNGV